jgi:ABC-type Mn2+/Zn2+ transport system ATPase subunit
MTARVRIDHLVVGYESRPVARVDTLELAPDRVTLVVGPNGAGKTTLLKTLGGLLRPLAGAIVPRLAAGPGGAVFVHSTAFLFAGSVRKNLLLASRHREEAAREALSALGVDAAWTMSVSQLSMGQRQRVAIARALVARPSVLLVDEPEGGMDAEALRLWRDVVTRALAGDGPSIVIAAHRPAALAGVPLQTVVLRSAGTDAPVPYVAALDAAGGFDIPNDR